MFTSTSFKMRRGNSVLWGLAAGLFLTFALAGPAMTETDQSDKVKTVRQVAQYFLDTGKEQLQRGYYTQAEQSFLRALDYEQLLTDEMRAELQTLAQQAQTAVAARKQILSDIQTADGLIKQGQLVEARPYLEQIKDSQYLTADERQQVAEGLQKLDEQLSKLQKNRVGDVYRRSIELYGAGEFERARQGFLEVVRNGPLGSAERKSAEEYLLRIDSQLRQQKMELSPLFQPQRTPANAAQAGLPVRGPAERPATNERPVRTPTAADQRRTAAEDTHIEKVLRQRNIRRDYTKIVMADANETVQQYLGGAQFDKAKEVVERARRTVGEFQLDLGEELFNRYAANLAGLSDQIAEQEAKHGQRQAEAKTEAVRIAQEQYRMKTEAERRKRVSDLMTNAREYQKKQRYEEAMGQLELLLALAPLNGEALLLKQTLEDTISYRDQLEVRRQSQREKVGILVETDRSAIPHAEDLVYAKDWREIEAKRLPYETAAGLDPLDAAVYEQLEKIVDLASWSPDMPFGDALKVLGDSVEPALQIQPIWGELYDYVNIDRLSPANVEPAKGVRVRAALQTLLDQVSGGLGDLGYVVKEGIIYVRPQETLPSNLITRVYDVRDLLLATPGEFMSMTGGGMGMGGMGMGGMGMGGMGMGGMGMGGGYGGMGGGYGGMGGGYGGMGGGYGGMGGGYGGYGGGGRMGGGYGGMGGRMGGYGGMGGGYGGMGGMGMGGMGMGGMGMGGMGMGGMGMGGMGIDYNREYREQLLLQLIELTIEPESWESYGMGGQGMITPYQGKKLAIFQTPEIHKQIEELFSQMREALGHQVSIESRFLIVAESFLEDIGLDVDFRIRPGGKWALIDISQEHSEAVAPSTTRVPGSLGGTIRGMEVEGGYGTVFDDLQVHFLLRALEAYTDAKALTAPLVTVVSGEMAMMQVMTDTVIALPPAVGSIDITAGVSGITSQQQFIPQLATVNSGTTLTVTPVITRDKKHVVLNITTMLNEFLGLKEYNLETPLPDGTIAEFTQSLPETEMSTVSTQVTVPDGGTLLLGGQKVRVEVEKEAGVPILGKVPVLGRLFRNRSTVRDTRTLLILVKPTIILQEERDAEAYGRLEPVL